MKKFRDKRPSLQQLQDQFRASMPHDQDPSKLPVWMLETPRAPRKEGVRNKSEEHDDQAAVVKYLHTFCPQVLVAASLNGELRPMGEMGKFYGWIKKLKSRGMLTGDSDLRLTWYPRKCAFIEMKKRKGGVTSEAQEKVRNTLLAQGFPVYILNTGIDGLKQIIKQAAIPCLDVPTIPPLPLE